MKKYILSAFEITDAFQFMGLILLGVGLFLWFGLGVALTVDGALLFLIGYFSGALSGKKK